MGAPYTAAPPMPQIGRRFVDIDAKIAIGAHLFGGVPEWLKGADCKSAGARLRWFESNPLHQNPC